MTAPSADTSQPKGPFSWLELLRTLPPWRQAVYWLASIAALALLIWDIVDKSAQYTSIAVVALVVIATVALRAPNPRRGEGPPHPLTWRERQ